MLMRNRIEIGRLYESNEPNCSQKLNKLSTNIRKRKTEPKKIMIRWTLDNTLLIERERERERERKRERESYHGTSLGVHCSQTTVEEGGRERRRMERSGSD